MKIITLIAGDNEANAYIYTVGVKGVAKITEHRAIS